MATAQGVVVILVGLEGATEAFHFDAPDDVGHLSLIETEGAVCLEKRDQGMEVEDLRAYIGFELCVAGKDDQRMEGIQWQVGKKLLECPDVALVLVQRVLKAMPGLVEDLGPCGVVWCAKDPAGIVFGFDDEDACVGDQDMVDLRGVAVDGDGDVVEKGVRVVEAVGDGVRDHGFADVLPVENVLVKEGTEDQPGQEREHDQKEGEGREDHRVRRTMRAAGGRVGMSCTDESIEGWPRFVEWGARGGRLVEG